MLIKTVIVIVILMNATLQLNAVPASEMLLIDQFKNEIKQLKTKSDSDDGVMKSLRLMIDIHKHSSDMYKRSMESINGSFYLLKSQLDNVVNVLKTNTKQISEERKYFRDILLKKQIELKQCLIQSQKTELIEI